MNKNEDTRSTDPEGVSQTDAPPLSTALVAGYGAASAPFEMLRAPALAILPALYAKEYGMEMTLISLALLLLRLSDGATDVIVGIWSDRTRSRWGPRKPWLFASIFLAVPAAYGLYVPGEAPSIWTFSICYFFFYLAWTLFDIPYTAWSSELATRYEDRSRLALSRGLGQNIGLILLTLVPLLPFLPSTEMNFDTLHAMFWVVAVVYPLGVLYTVFRLPVGHFVASARTFSLRETFAAIRGNRPLTIFLGVCFLSDFALGCFQALFFLFFDSYLGLGTSFTLIFLSAIIVSTFSLRGWQVLVKRTSKNRLLVISLAATVLHGLLIALLEPGPYALPVFITYLAAFYALQAGRDAALYAIFGDVVDYDTLHTGENRAGQFSAAWMILRKIGYAVAPAVAFFVAGIAGYDPSGTSAQSDLAVFGLKAANGYLPALFMAAALILALRFPLTASVHADIRRQLDERAAGSAAR